ncbi:dTMP kinase [Siculibacillus lacustris]|uniref:Thymidylate kinase n=1 Tax=Siculibacillus lacustris TaxID=1549641 RepID=A0A4Q9VN81_9HYPH|nr:dTMP kinase [Siculibacillus lacustris]TBW37003.1 dTMP kinase [Siculibacillus lacustris]
MSGPSEPPPAGAEAPDRPIRRGRFVTFEGGEGTGKSTQIARLADRLRAGGLDVVATREPGGSPGAECVRHVLLSGGAEAFGPLAEAILFAAARADHVDTTIRPALDRGAWVLSDRFYDSARVYQGADGAVPAATLAALEDAAVGDTRPDLTVLLDLRADIGLARAAARRGAATVDRFEREAVAVHEARRLAFLKLAGAEPERFLVVDAARDAAAVAEAVWNGLCSRLGRPTAP